jgi:hypothetical protein
MDLAGHEGGRHRQGEQVGRQVPWVRNLLQLHSPSATIPRGKDFKSDQILYPIMAFQPNTNNTMAFKGVNIFVTTRT